MRGPGLVLWVVTLWWGSTASAASVASGGEVMEAAGGRFPIEGRVVMPQDSLLPAHWQSYTRVLANYGQFIGFIRSSLHFSPIHLEPLEQTKAGDFREDGSFRIDGVPPGSYIVEVASRDFIFEPFRVDITSKGKFRGRKINFLQPAAVHQVIASSPSRF